MTFFHLDASPQFPVGTVLGVYLSHDQSAKNAEPAGGTVSSATVASDGTATFGSLDYDTDYVAAANLSDVVAFPDWRWKRFTTNPLGQLTFMRGRVHSTGVILGGDAFSVTKNGTGDYSVAVDGSYTTEVTPSVTPHGTSAAFHVEILSVATTGFRVLMRNAAGTAADASFTWVAVSA